MTVEKTSVLVLDCAEPIELAGFYAQLLGAQTRVGSDPDFVEVVGQRGVHLAIHRDHGYAPPSWPRPEDSQQAHLRIVVAEEDMDEAEREAIGLGARPVETKDNSGPRDVRVYSDPAGHSFSLAVYPLQGAALADAPGTLPPVTEGAATPPAPVTAPPVSAAPLSTGPAPATGAVPAGDGA